MSTATNSIDAELLQELEKMAQESGCELVHCEFKGGVLRLVLDRPEGITLDDCQKISKQASVLLDVADFGSGRYLLEVSSPGLDRPLYRERDYERFVGRNVRVTWQDETMLHKRTLVARLEAFSSEPDKRVTLMDEQSAERYTIPLKFIKLARLEPDF